MSDWHEDDEFWTAAIGPMFDEKAWAEAGRQAEQLVTLLELEPPARILDLGCGPGRFCIPLARLGFRVTGVDRTRPFLAEAERRIAEAGVEVELVEADMREFARPGGFDATISMLTSFGYFEDPADDRRVVENVCGSLPAGAPFLIDTYGKEVLARIYQERDWREQDGELWLQERRLESGWSWMNNRWIRIVDGERQEFRFGHRLFSAHELEALMATAGFSSTASYGGLDAEPYDQEAGRLIVVGRK